MKYNAQGDYYETSFESDASSELPIEPKVWRYQLLVSVPKQVSREHVFLYLSSGDNAHTELHAGLKKIRDCSGSVVAQLRIFTNGPICEGKSGKIISEDHVIALSWKHFLQTQDPSCLVQLQLQDMVIRAISEIEDFIVNIKGFKFNGLVVSGQSKRAQLSWLAASRDQRIVGLIPMVYDMLNFYSNMKHHYNVYGFWAEALTPYSEYEIPSFLDSKEFKQLAKFIDPYYFGGKIEIPKYMINAANDEYFLPDSSQFYYQNLKGPKGIRYLPNHGHRLEDQGMDYWDVVYSAFLLMIEGISFPVVQWQKTEQGLNVSYEREPIAAYLWQANAEKRDFRLGPSYPQFKSSKLGKLDGDRENLLIKPLAESRWQAFFVELVYGFPKCKAQLSLTTDVVISENEKVV